MISKMYFQTNFSKKNTHIWIKQMAKCQQLLNLDGGHMGGYCAIL